MEIEKGTDIIRRIDDLGRIVIPKEIRRNLRIKEGDAFVENVITENGVPIGVAIKKYDQIKSIKDSVEYLMSQLRNERYDLNLSSDTFARVMNALNEVCRILERSDK